MYLCVHVCKRQIVAATWSMIPSLSFHFALSLFICIIYYLHGIPLEFPSKTLVFCVEISLDAS